MPNQLYLTTITWSTPNQIENESYILFSQSHRRYSMKFYSFEFIQTYVADILLSQSWKDHRLRLPDDITDNDYVTDTDYFSKNDNLTYYEDYDDAPKDYR